VERGDGVTSKRKQIIIMIVCRCSYAGLVCAVSCHASDVTWLRICTLKAVGFAGGLQVCVGCQEEQVLQTAV
jgi:hypothetical protein